MRVETRSAWLGTNRCSLDLESVVYFSYLAWKKTCDGGMKVLSQFFTSFTKVSLQLTTRISFHLDVTLPQSREDELQLRMGEWSGKLLYGCSTYF